MVLECPAAAHAMFRMFGVDSVAHRVPRQTSMLEVSGCGAYCRTCFLDFSRGLSARNAGLVVFGHDAECFHLALSFLAWDESPPQLISRLKRVAGIINAKHDVAGLCRALPARIAELVRRGGGKLAK